MNNISLDRFINKSVVEINDIYPVLIFDREASLTIECSWRLRNEDKIIVGSGEYKMKETHKKANDLLSNLILGQHIIYISIASIVSDLYIEFSNGAVLEMFSDSSLYEGWTLADGKDFLLVSLPGGETSFLEND